MLKREAGRVHMGQRSVLLMDDSEIVLEAVRSVFELNGVTVRCCEDIPQLEKELERGAHDLVVLDVQMPDAYGDDIGQVLRQMRGMKIPIVLFSSLEDDDLASRTKEAQLDGYVPKRSGPVALLAMVNSLLDAREN
jgi:DNA-binding response OmpR family regulator